MPTDLEKQFNNISLTQYLETLDNENWYWVVKRLSGNDTGLTGGHQVGLYMPRHFFQSLFPEICVTNKLNPDSYITECFISNCGYYKTNIRAIYYNNKYFPELGLKKKYDEFRLTQWGGKSCPFQDHENTGSVIVFACQKQSGKVVSVPWVAQSIAEEELIENWLGEEVEPGQLYYKDDYKEIPLVKTGIKIPEGWFANFPSGLDIFNYVIDKLPHKFNGKSVNDLLLMRRQLEFDIFKFIEHRHVFPNIKNGFSDVSDFISYANSVSNRRKSRTGKSLELNLEQILKDEYIEFETQVKTELRKKPDFIFPSGEAYHNPAFDVNRLHMLAAKTCCKDRWRQVINEADRISHKHLFTLQQGVSSAQLAEMKAHNILLVIPKANLKSFPKEWHKEIITLSSFVDMRKRVQAL